jgi:uncharacterized membrane protein YhiD involved in acid resistance
MPAASLPSLADLDTPLRLAVAGLIGLAIGVEREWSGHAFGPRDAVGPREL